MLCPILQYSILLQIMAEGEKAEERWLPIESNPEVMNSFLKKLGVPDDWEINDVFGLDPELLLMLPQPVLALLLLFPITEKYESFARELREAPTELAGGLGASDLRLLRQHHVAGVELVGDLHDGDPSLLVTVAEAPLDRGCAPVERQQRRVRVDHPVGWDAHQFGL